MSENKPISLHLQRIINQWLRICRDGNNGIFSISSLMADASPDEVIGGYANALLPNEKIKMLSFTAEKGRPFTDEAAGDIARAIRKAQGLEQFFLSNGELTEKGLAVITDALLEQPKLSKVRLNYLQLGDAGASLKKIMAMPTLLNIDLNHSGLSEEAAQEFCAALKGNDHLKCVGLQEPGLSDAAYDLFVQTVIYHNHTLEKVSIFGPHGGKSLPWPGTERAYNPFLQVLSSPHVKERFSDLAQHNLIQLHRCESGLQQLLRGKNVDPDMLREIDKRRVAFFGDLPLSDPHVLKQSEAQELREAYDGFIAKLPPLPPEGPDFMAQLFVPNASGYAPIDNPANFRDFEQTLRLWRDQPWTRKEFDRRSEKGSTLLDALSAILAVPMLIQEANQRNLAISATHLLDNGEMTPFYHNLQLEKSALLEVFSSSNVAALSREEIRHIYEVLPEKSRAEIPGLHRILSQKRSVESCGPGR